LSEIIPLAMYLNGGLERIPRVGAGAPVKFAHGWRRMTLFSQMSRLPPPERAGSLHYLPQLDAVRAFAVSLVLWHHWYGPPEIPLGPIGVWIFFVISGFLITRILLNSRSDTSQGNRRALLTFYVRRVLRILPLYYLVLLIGFATSASLRATWPWYAAYLQNFKVMLNENDPLIFGPHLWSLAVEEQFYLLWPLAILFAPRILLLPMIASAVALAIASRIVCTQMGWTAFQVYAFTPNNLDTLGLGALLAYFVTHRPKQVIVLRRFALIAGLIVWLAVAQFKVHMLAFRLMAMPTALITLWMIARIWQGIGGLAGRAMAFPPSVFMGRISYGIYIYHHFVPGLLKPLLHRFQIEEREALFIAICFVATISIATLSWFLFENPINSLKDKFSVSSRTRERINDELRRSCIPASD
jgi:peptidoglycan/LPS O-acetylase OafA/YrhL